MLFLLEVCIGGSGGFFQFGPLTLRKINFIFAIIISLFFLFSGKKIHKEVIYLTVSFLILLSIAFITGILHYGSDSRVYENFFMQSFFLILPFYSLFIKNDKDVKTVSSIIIISCLLMAVSYLTLVALIYFKLISFEPVYLLLTQSDEFLGRGDFAFWYKGFLYMCVGVYFLDNIKKPLIRYALQFIVLAAIFFTFARGFLLALILTSFLFNLFFSKFWKSLIMLVVGFVLFLVVKQVFLNLSVDKTESDRIRVVQLAQVFQRTDMVNTFIGNGFGEGVPIRDNHMEINYLEILYKQGLIGLFFWLFLLIYIIILYLNNRADGYEKASRPFLLASFFVYFQSATNPFLTNSIGMNVVMLSILSLHAIKYKRNDTYLGSNSNI